MPTAFDESVPVEVQLSFDSPQVVSYVLFVKKPGGKYEQFAHGTDEDAVQVSLHLHQLGPVPKGSGFKYRIIFDGNPGSAIKATITLQQNGADVCGSPFKESGAVGNDGVAVRSREVKLA